jgi:osmoprotectant transport system ATP-binding protein
MSLALDALALEHDFGTVPALRGVTVHVPAGELLAIVGESGSGKTTLLRSFNRMVEPHGGTVRVGGEDVRAVPAEVLRRRIGYVPQLGGLMPHWTVRRNVALVPRLVRAPDADAMATAALTLVGLDPRAFGDRFPHELSGGQRQRVALARALAARQEVVLLDEPFGALDAISRSEVHDAFARIRAELRFTAILVTHDLAEAARLADAIAVMRQGRIEQVGTPHTLRDAPATAYVRDLLARATAAGAALVTA